MRLRMMAAAAVAAAAGGLTLIPTPAQAQDTGPDVGITLVGTTIAEGAAGKFGTLTLTNHGPGAASGIGFTYDVSGLDTSKVDILLPDCTPDGSGIADCVIDPDGLADGEHVNFVDFLQAVPGATGAAGSITMSIRHSGDDPVPGNNSVTVPVTIAGSGPDLLVIAPDVRNPAQIDPDAFEIEVLQTPVLPGSEAVVEVFVANQGTSPATGLEMSISLPEHVTFTLPEAECSHGVGDSTTTCGYGGVTLPPGYGPDTETCDVGSPCAWFVFPVRVSEDAPSPQPSEQIGLTGGVAEAWAMEVALFAAAGQPRNLVEGPAPEVDPTDNVSEFSVLLGGWNDLAVSSEPAAGGVGEVVEVDFAMTNRGPYTSAPSFRVEAPAGTVVPHDAGVFDATSGDYPTCTVDGSPEWADATELSCSFEGELQPGVTIEFQLPFEITSPEVGEDGRITAQELQGMDRNPDNDTAPIVITVGGGGQGGGLPVTGAPAVLIGGTGAAVLAVGTALFVVARRRRVVLAAPDTDG